MGEVLSVEAGLEINELESTLEKLQKAEPTGIFARNLSECLRLQILEKDLLCDKFSILLDNLSLLGKGDLLNLKKKIGCDEQQIKDFLVVIRGLDPKPGSSFSSNDSHIHKPDL